MYRPDDRKLTLPDVQKIAEAILLWFGHRPLQHGHPHRQGSPHRLIPGYTGGWSSRRPPHTPSKRSTG